MYYSCIVVHGEPGKTADEYFYQGKIIVDGNNLNITCPSTALLCNDIFHTNNKDVLQIIPDNADDFINLINQLFSNQYNAIYSELQLQGAVLKPAKGIENTKEVIFATVDLNTLSFKLLVNPF